jgi:hypothetical protein
MRQAATDLARAEGSPLATAAPSLDSPFRSHAAASGPSTAGRQTAPFVEEQQPRPALMLVVLCTSLTAAGQDPCFPTKENGAGT